MEFVRIKSEQEAGCRQAMALYAVSFALHEQRLPESLRYIF